VVAGGFTPFAAVIAADNGAPVGDVKTVIVGGLITGLFGLMMAIAPRLLEARTRRRNPQDAMPDRLTKEIARRYELEAEVRECQTRCEQMTVDLAETEDALRDERNAHNRTRRQLQECWQEQGASRQRHSSRPDSNPNEPTSRP
jgi:hypothetical protein